MTNKTGSKGWYNESMRHSLSAQGIKTNQALAINQVGARALKHKNKTYYEIGGGLFTKKQVLEARRREGEIKYGMHTNPEAVGLKSKEKKENSNDSLKKKADSYALKADDFRNAGDQKTSDFYEKKLAETENKIEEKKEVSNEEYAKDLAERTNKVMYNKRVAIEILRQLGGKRFIAFTGAKNFVSTENSAGFNIPHAQNKINAVKITLNEMDTYDIEFLNTRAGKRDIISKHTGIYNDQLGELFQRETGLYTHF